MCLNSSEQHGHANNETPTGETVYITLMRLTSKEKRESYNESILSVFVDM